MMNISLGEFEIIGISVRTTNQHRQAEKDIGDLWHRFYSSNLISDIPGKWSQNIYCLYTDYETDHMGPYTTLIGCRVKPGTPPIPGFEKVTVKINKYEVFISEGQMPDALQQTWMKIWNSRLQRSYTTDFDLYVPDDNNPGSAKVETYVAIK